MKVLLINPAYHGWFSLFGVRIPPLGLAYLAASLRDAGHEPVIHDMAVATKDEPLSFDGFDIVGIGTDTTRFRVAVEVARQAKAAGKTVVMGGPHPTVVDDAPIKTGVVDYVVRGEGEDTLVELLAAIGAGREPDDVTGLTYRRNGRITKTPDRPFREDLDSLPWPARDLLHMDRYRTAKIGDWPLTPVVTSRGCPFRCAFCASSFMNGPKWRPHSARRVVDEIEHVQREYGYPAVAFSDDNSTLDATRTTELCDEILARNIDVKIWCFCRADQALRHPETVPLMARAGFKTVFIGIETLSKRRLKEIKKGFGPETAPAAVRLFRSHGMDVLGSYIIGYPDETLAEIRETVRQARAIPSSTAQFQILTPYPGTRVFHELKDRIRSWNWAHYDGFHAVFQPKRVSRFSLQMMLAYSHLAFYFRSWESVFGFARFAWKRKKDFAEANKVFHDMFIAPDVDAGPERASGS